MCDAKRNGRKLPGFTLVELLVVIGIIALLISILLPSLAKARQSAQSIACLSNLKQLGNLFSMYISESNGMLPPAMQRWENDNWAKVSWDDLLSVQAGVKFANDMDFTGPYPGDQTYPNFTAPTPLIRCPVDSPEYGQWTWVRAELKSDLRTKRSYSMVMNEWGSGPNGQTISLGTGANLMFQQPRGSAVRSTGSFWSARTATKIVQVARTAEKLLLVENFQNNTAGSDSGSMVNVLGDCNPNWSIAIHPGKRNNYLFCDFHAESRANSEILEPGETPISRPAKGAWLIN